MSPIYISLAKDIEKEGIPRSRSRLLGRVGNKRLIIAFLGRI